MDRQRQTNAERATYVNALTLVAKGIIKDRNQTSQLRLKLKQHRCDWCT